MGHIENWTMDREDIEKALKLQEMRKEAGINRPQMAELLGMDHVNYMDYERAHVPIPPTMLRLIEEVLEKVKSGKLKPSDNPSYVRRKPAQEAFADMKNSGTEAITPLPVLKGLTEPRE